MYWLSKRVLPTPALESADPALILAYRLWADRRIEGYLPARCQLDSPQFRLMIPDVQWLDIAVQGWARPLHLTGHSDAIAAEIGSARPSALLSDALIENVRLTSFTGSPLFQIVELSRDGMPASLQILFLPFADDGVRVSEILVVSRVADFSLDFGQLVASTIDD